MKRQVQKILNWTEKYFKTDILYLAKGSAWYVLSRVFSALISFATMFAFARWISKETFGAYEYILSIVSLFAVLSLPGINNALIRASAKGKEGMLALCTKIRLKWSVFASLLCLLTALWYLGHQNYILGYSFLIACALLPFTRVFNTFLAFFIGKKRFDLEAKSSIAINVLEALFFIPIIFLTNNLVIIMLAYFITRSIFPVMFYWFTQKRVTNKTTDNETILFGKHLTIMQALNFAAEHIDKIIIWQYLGPVAVATYAFAWAPVQRIGGFIPISTIALPKLSEKNFSLIKKELFKKFLKFFLLSAPMALVLAILAPWAYKIFFPAYLTSVPYAQILAITLALIPFSLLSTSLVASKKTWELYIIQTFTPLLKIALFFALVPIWGIWGIVFAIISTRFLGGLLTIYLFQRAV
jgi:O-antigen/teichoic acid export membrane protein